MEEIKRYINIKNQMFWKNKNKQKKCNRIILDKIKLANILKLFKMIKKIK